ncbi:MAG: tRNA lysidine(34) synthetase TilS [Candidatus Lernaella stagnicola]|nr:tRNA lysidine(34) synthetase TilS [Candidatus Lernaella stagnicola]
MPDKILASAWRRYGRPDRFGVAFSGGGDSMALLVAAHAVARKVGATLVALHVDHALRPESASEAEVCRAQADRLGVAFQMARLQPGQLSGNIHDSARGARYEALSRMADEESLAAVFTAHTLDDQVETIFHRILRGTGPSGLRGIGEEYGVFRRPWLGMRRETLRAYLKAASFEWLEDPSNDDPRYLRTRIRQTMLPLAEEIGGAKAWEAIGRLAEIAHGEREVLEELAAADLADCRVGRALRVDRLQQFSEPRRFLVLRRWLAEDGIVPPRHVVEDLDHLATAPGPAGPVAIPGGGKIVRDYELLNRQDEGVVYPLWDPFPAAAEGVFTFADGRLELDVRADADAAPDIVLVTDSLMRAAQWRPAWPGARIQPIGMEGRVKCSDLFGNEKIPRDLRLVWPLLARDDSVLLVPGLRSAKALISHRENEKTWAVRFKWLY